MKKRLYELRCDTHVNYNPKASNRLRHLAESISTFYLSKMGVYYIEDTKIIIINFITIEFEEVNEYFYSGKNRNGLGSTGFHFPFEKFIELSEKEKKLFILEKLHYILIKYTIHFNLPIEPLKKAYEEIKVSDFYAKYSKKYISKIKKISFWIEILSNFDNNNYRLAYQIKKDGIQYLEVCTKEYFFGVEHPEMDFEEVMNTPMYLEEKGWIDDKNFEMAWGEEKYIFNTDELKITAS